MMRGFIFFFVLLAAVPAWGESSVLRVGEARQEVELTGYTRSRIDVMLSAEVSGKVLEVGYDVGDVIGDDPFVRIDPTFVDYSIDLARQNIAQLDASLAQNESRTEFLAKEFGRIDALYRKNSTSEQRWDQARQQLDQARLERRSLLAKKEVAKTQLEELKERKTRHDVHAPAGWRVTARHVDPGEIVSPSMQLASVGDFRRLSVPLSVTAQELAAIRKLGETFEVRLDGRRATGSIRWVNPEFDPKTRKLAIELSIESWTGEHRGGLVLKLPVEIPAPGLSVPKAAVVDGYDNPRVRLKKTGEVVSVLVLGETNSHLRIADNPKLKPGVELVAAEKP